ncbi:hypothetical protein GGF32_004823 [Allomyces javanicus]|nr:hypothetical protein GGF32_004823 [Allomyces javanicus]
MRHGLALRKLGRDSSHRRALLRNLVSSLVLHDRITTTLPKAKEAQALADKMITLAKKNTPQARKAAAAFLFQHSITMPKLFDALAARYANRPGGYTRIIKTGFNPRDSSPTAILEYVDAPGDTKIAMAAQQLPALHAKQKQLRAQLREVEGVTARAGKDKPWLDGETKGNLLRRMRALEKVESKLTRVAQMPFLPEGHNEVKTLKKGQEIRVDKKVWVEALGDRDRHGKPRHVVKVKRRTSIVEVAKVSIKDKKRTKITNQHLAV